MNHARLFPLYAFIALGLAFLPYPPTPVARAKVFEDPRATLVDDRDLVFAEEPSITGIATWFDASKNRAWYTRTTELGDPIEYYAAAGPELRKLLGDPDPYRERYAVKVTNLKTGISLLAWVVDWCSCSEHRSYERAIDLSPELFVALGVPLGHGIQLVKIERLDD